MGEEDEALAVPESREADPYERQYMRGHGMVLHRDKRPAPVWLQVALGASGFAGFSLLFTPAWLTGLFLVPLGFVLWALFSVLRCTVSEGAVNVQYGLFGPTIPMGAIQSAAAVDYDWKKFGGWGIRRSLDGEQMYNMPGDGGRAVRIVWTDEKGQRRITNIGTPNPESVVGAIGKARRALSVGSSPKALDEFD